MGSSANNRGLMDSGGEETNRYLGGSAGRSLGENDTLSRSPSIEYSYPSKEKRPGISWEDSHQNLPSIEWGSENN